jgi:hypothetical protein
MSRLRLRLPTLLDVIVPTTRAWSRSSQPSTRRGLCGGAIPGARVSPRLPLVIVEPRNRVIHRFCRGISVARVFDYSWCVSVAGLVPGGDPDGVGAGAGLLRSQARCVG